MNAVVLTVKASYIASTKYRNKSGNKEVKFRDFQQQKNVHCHRFSRLFNGKCVYQRKNLWFCPNVRMNLKLVRKKIQRRNVLNHYTFWANFKIKKKTNFFLVFLFVRWKNSFHSSSFLLLSSFISLCITIQLIYTQTFNSNLSSTHMKSREFFAHADTIVSVHFTQIYSKINFFFSSSSSSSL